MSKRVAWNNFYLLRGQSLILLYFDNMRDRPGQARVDWADFVFAFNNGEEIGPKMLARIAKHTD